MEAFGVWAVDCALPVRKESLPSTGRLFETGWFARCAMLIAAFSVSLAGTAAYCLCKSTAKTA